MLPRYNVCNNKHYINKHFILAGRPQAGVD